MKIGYKKRQKQFFPISGEKINFLISNNGNNKWKNASPEVIESAKVFLDECIEAIQLMKKEITE